MLYLQLWRKRLGFQVSLGSIFQFLAKIEEDCEIAVTIEKKSKTKRKVVN